MAASSRSVFVARTQHPHRFRSALIAGLALASASGCSEGSSGSTSTTSQDSTSADAEDAAAGMAHRDASVPDNGAIVGEANRIEGEFPVALAKGLAPTPPMGWNSWNKFACNTSAEQIETMADAMAESGMKDVGYEFINIDDCWHEAEREEDGMPNPTDNFPDGIKPVADYVHDLGLKLGIYSDRGDETCARRHGSRGYVDTDVKAWADWGVDYLKYDNCDYIYPDEWEHNLDEDLMKEEFTLMSEALADAERDIVFSVCAWRFYEWAVPLGQLWRTTGDIEDTWESIVKNIGINSNGLAAYAGPGQWNDPDMLEVGNGGMTATEYKAHFSMWAIMAAPLIAGNDLRTMSDETRDILTNAEVIAVDQDALGYQGVKIKEQGEKDLTQSVWVKPLNEHGARAVAFLNLDTDEQTMSIDVTELALQDTEVSIRDLWEKSDLEPTSGSIEVTIPGHGVVMYKVVGEEPAVPRGTVSLVEHPWVYTANRQGPVELNQSNGGDEQNDGDPISIGGQEYESGLGTAAASLITYRLGGNCSKFEALVGVDDQASNAGSVVFEVWGDGEKLYTSDVLEIGDPAVDVEVDVSDVYRLNLKVTNAMDGTARDYASWAEPVLSCDE